MQMMAHRRQIQCPVCNAILTVEHEQDRRVAFMQHGDQPSCPFSNKLFRVDRYTGYTEEVIRAQPTEVQVPSSRVPSPRPIGEGED